MLSATSEDRDPMTTNPPLIESRTVTVVVLTYQRNEDLVRAVRSVLDCAATGKDPIWTLLEVLVVDNNPDGSAKAEVAALGDSAVVPLRYVHETTPGIVAARNRALSEAAGRVLVFLDDDEVALPGWPSGLLSVMAQTGAALVGGPVMTEFEHEPPKWALQSGFFDPENVTDGAARSWLSTCNLAVDLEQINREGLRFDTRYPHGEDVAFSRSAASSGLDLRWSATALVKEHVGPERTTLQWRRHRQRISTDAWVRVELDLDPSPKTELIIVAKAGVRLLQAIVTASVGKLRRHRGTHYAGLILFSHVRGSIDGLRAHRRERSTSRGPASL
jgi:glycosyltransferase involved in cell wall biosynthesis